MKYRMTQHGLLNYTSSKEIYYYLKYHAFFGTWIPLMCSPWYTDPSSLKHNHSPPHCSDPLPNFASIQSLTLWSQSSIRYLAQKAGTGLFHTLHSTLTSWEDDVAKLWFKRNYWLTGEGGLATCYVAGTNTARLINSIVLAHLTGTWITHCNIFTMIYIKVKHIVWKSN